MTKQELIEIEDYDMFITTLNKAKISKSEKAILIKKRWHYLWDKYKPEKFKRGDKDV